MRRKIGFLMVACLLIAAGAWLFWPKAEHGPANSGAPEAPAAASATGAAATAAATKAVAAEDTGVASAATTNRLAFRLANTPQSVGELMSARHAILLENALIDTELKTELAIPRHLQAAGDPGAYIVQARGAIDGAFRAVVAGAGAQVVSYIPNDALLVQVSAAGAAGLAASPRVHKVLPYEPYYKLQPALLGLAVAQKALPPGQVLTLGLFAGGAAETAAKIEKLGGIIIGQDRSPFGPVVRVQPPDNWLALVQLPGVQRVEPTHKRVAANDLARVAVGVAANTLTNVSYLDLYGSNVLVEVNDTGIDDHHPDFSLTGSAAAPGSVPPSRVSGDSTNSLYDTDGHGTHVAGIIAGNGSQSITPTNVGAFARGSVTNADFRGKAPLANLFAVDFNRPDRYLQEAPALTNALISNNSWIYGGANEYDLAAASYDAAVRDALPETMGPQPVLFVFAAGNTGGGNDSGSGGSADTVLSPGTAKDVITVGSLEQFRNITNTYLPLGSTNPTVAWQAETSSGTEVAGYSARGNVGVQTEGNYGRFKPDVIAPGTFVVSTRSTVWDQEAYYNPTNYHSARYLNQMVSSNTLNYGFLTVPQNAVSVTIAITRNANSPNPLPPMPIYVAKTGFPDPNIPASYDFVQTNTVSIPPDSGGNITGIQSLLNSSFNFAVADGTNFDVSYNLTTTIITTNDLGNQLEVLSNLNETIGPFYLYRSGTSMAAPAASGVLALMQDFFVNQRNPNLATNPSPALMKAMLINGARPVGGYRYAVTNSINLQGWGLVELTNSIPLALTNTAATTNLPIFFLDQSPTNALATGDSRTYLVSVPTALSRAKPLRITLTWTDPPGNPAAAIKLVNNLDLVVTNLANNQVYYGNNFSAASASTIAATTNDAPAWDAVNNVENIFISPTLATNYSITVIGRGVNVNAVTAEQTNIVQDFALVVSSGDGNNTNGFGLTAAAPGLASAIAPAVTNVVSTNGIIFNQIAGANAPWLSTNVVMFGTNSVYATNAMLFIGQTNQWRFYVVTNLTSFTNAAFITFLPNTLATPREGVFSSYRDNYTRPEADIDLFVASEGSLTNLDPAVLANCVTGQNGDVASLGRDGTEFVFYTNSTLNQVYYVGVKCEDQMAGQYGFISVFSEKPFSQTDADGNQIVNGLLIPSDIPDGNNAHAGVAYVLGLAILPMQVRNVTVTNIITHQNFGDLFGILSHGGMNAVLNNHDGLGEVIDQMLVYDDSGEGRVPGAIGSDGPEKLTTFQGTEGIGPWFMTMLDDAQTQVGSISGFSLRIEPHVDMGKGLRQVVVQPGAWYYDYIDAPVGGVNLTVVATNLPPDSVPPIQLYLDQPAKPTSTNYLARADLTNGPLPGASISYGPPLPPGRYWVGLFNPDTVAHTVLIGARLTYDANAITMVNAGSAGNLALLDDAVTYDSILVTDRDLIQHINVGLRVDHERISDLVFHLISPDGTRHLLMENRGGQSTNGCGATTITTNFIPVNSSGGRNATTNLFDLGYTAGNFTINWDFYTVPDTMDVYYQGVNIFSSGLVSFAGSTNLSYAGSSSQIMVVMNATNHPAVTLWDYTLSGTQVHYDYLTFTEDTNLTTTPIKYAVPPFTNNVLTTITTNAIASLTNIWSNGFEGGAGSVIVTPSAGSYFASGWHVDFGSVDWLPTGYAGYIPYQGSYFIDLDGSAAGGISTNITTVPGKTYTLNFAYTKNPGFGATPTPGAQFLIDGNPLGTATVNFANSAGSLNWRTNSFTFTATLATTTLTINSLDPSGSLGGVFLDALSLTTTVTNSSLVTNQTVLNYYVLPEQSLDPLIGTSAFGEWQLEVLDNRAGAGLTNTLVSWQLALEYLNTNYVAPPMFWATPSNQTLIEETTLVVPNPAFSFYPFVTLTYSLQSAPWWAGIDAFGDITLSPDEAAGPGTYTITTVVSDSNVPSLSATNSFDVTVLESNLPPVFVYPANGFETTNYVLVPFSLQCVATDPDIPANALTFALVSATDQNGQPVTNLNVSASGLLTWTPTLAQGPSTNTVAVSVTDFNPFTIINPPSFSVTNVFTLIVLTLNTPPFWTNGYPDVVMDELTVSNLTTGLALDLDVPPDTLTYSLGGGTPGWVTIDPFTGVITLTPLEVDGPSTNNITVVVTDNGIPNMSATTNFTVVVNEVNLPPVFEYPTNGWTTNIFELEPFTLQCGASDPDVPANTWTFALVGATNLLGDVITNLFVSTNGLITWTPDEIQGPSTNLVQVSVTDWNPWALTNQSYSVTNSFTIIVLESNTAPFWTNGYPAVVMDELTVTNLTTGLALDLDVPTNTLTYSLDTNTAPPWATIDPVTGVITLSPLEVDGPSTNLITAVVTDDGVPPLSATTNFTVIVNEVNLPPVFEYPTNGWTTNIFELEPFTLQCGASDPDVPANTWTFALVGATNLLGDVITNLFVSTNGLITWTPDEIQGPSTNLVQVSVTDWNPWALTNQSYSVTNTFTIIVLESNTAPFWTNGYPAVVMDELTVTNLTTGLALDLDVPTNTLTYSLDTNTAPPWATIDPVTGVITLSPLEVDGPSTNLITAVVTDNGVPPLSATTNFTVIVNEVNLPPVFSYPTNGWMTNLVEWDVFSLQCVATDPDVPLNPLTYALVSATNLLGQVITNLSVTTNGLISWTPDETQGPSTNIILVSVTDWNPWALTNQSYSVTNTFTIIVLESNTAPFWTNGYGDVVMDEMTVTNLTLGLALDADVPTNLLTYSLTNSPGWATIDPLTGVITLSPLEVDGPSTNLITAVVTDDGVPPLSATTNFTVVVNEVNRAPYWTTNVPSQTNYNVNVGATLTVTNTASDDDIPTNLLTYFLLTAPPNVLIDPNTGIITWSLTNAEVPGIYYITTVVTDTNPWALTNQSLSATNTFTVTVGLPPYASSLPATAVTGISATLNGFATPNGMAATAWFEWGTNVSYGNQTLMTNVGSGNDVVFVTDQIAGLVPGQIYHYRLVAMNGGVPVYGYDQLMGVGDVIAWGLNDFGQTNVPFDLINAVGVAGGVDHSLAVKNTGTVVGWGDNSSGQLSIPAGLSTAVAVSCGTYHSLALKSDGTVVAWGENIYDQTNVPSGLSNVVMVSASGSAYHSLALKRDGTVVAWGYNNDGETNVPVGLSNVVAVAGAGLHSLALKHDGTVVAWGWNDYGQTNVPAGLTNVVAVSGGLAHSLALRSDGSVVAWGAGAIDSGLFPDYGQAIVPAGWTATALTAGGFHSLLLATNGVVTAWGAGMINWGFPPYLGQAIVPAGLNEVLAVAGADQHTLAVQSAATAPLFVRAVSRVSSGKTSGGPVAANVNPDANAPTLAWNTPTKGMIQVQWKDDLAAPWNTITNPPITTIDGVSTFTETGEQTAPFTGQRFYRLVWVSTAPPPSAPVNKPHRAPHVFFTN